MPSIGFGFAEGRGRGAGSARAFLDPRTKMALLVAMPTVLFSGAGGPLATPLTLVFAFLAICLLFSCGNVGAAIGGVTAIALTQGAWMLLAPVLPSGLFLPVYIVYGIIVSVVPCFLMAAYAVSTTTVSEFISGMEKLHAPTLITIPLSVMFRFFPRSSKRQVRSTAPCACGESALADETSARWSSTGSFPS